MSYVSSATWVARPRAVKVSSSTDAVRVLQVFALAVMVIPSDIVIKPIGAMGYPAGLIGMLAFAVFVAATLLGLHDPRQYKYPVRGVLCVFWVVSLASYALMDRGSMNVHQLQGADRFLMQLAAMSGVALLAAECLNSLHDVRRVLRALSWGAAFCGVVAALQYKASIDLTPYLRMIPGFTHNANNAAILVRNGSNRVSGTGIDPIELGVAATMLLPLVIYLAIYDAHRKPWKRWLPVVLTALAIPASVSRSAILGIVLSMSLFIVALPPRQRLTAIFLAPVAVAMVFLVAHGLIGTLTAFLGYGTGDPSISHRTNNYPYVEQLVRLAPWLGYGGGTYIPEFIHILDNQYLTTAIELGLAGVVALGALFVLPMIFALIARHHSKDPELRLLCAALAGGALAATVCSATFDSLSFPMFYNVYALILGLIGACWRLANSASSTSTLKPPDRARGHGEWLALRRLDLSRKIVPAKGG